MDAREIVRITEASLPSEFAQAVAELQQARSTLNRITNKMRNMAAMQGSMSMHTKADGIEQLVKLLNRVLNKIEVQR